MLWSGVGGQLLSYHFGGLYSANLRSRFSQQIFSADFLSRSSQHLLSRSSQQIICCGQGLVVSYCLIICRVICCGQGLVVSYCLIILVVYTA